MHGLFVQEPLERQRHFEPVIGAAAKGESQEQAGLQLNCSKLCCGNRDPGASPALRFKK